MVAQVAWLLYAGFFYIGWMLGFRACYGRWPLGYRLRPRDFSHALYTLNDLGLNLSLIAYTLWLAMGPAPEPLSLGLGINLGAVLGILLVGAGAALRLWTVMTLGPNWRMGQDPGDEHTRFVSRGPYKLMPHPINTALVVVAVGQAFLTGFDVRAWFLLITAVAYYLAQGQAEKQFWEERRAAREGVESVVEGERG